MKMDSHFHGNDRKKNRNDPDKARLYRAGIRNALV